MKLDGARATTTGKECRRAAVIVVLIRAGFIPNPKNHESIFGTLIELGSRHFWKTVRSLSDICQKTVSYKNVSEKC